jgi:hypothetical protein
VFKCSSVLRGGLRWLPTWLQRPVELGGSRQTSLGGFSGLRSRTVKVLSLLSERRSLPAHHLKRCKDNKADKQKKAQPDEQKIPKDEPSKTRDEQKRPSATICSLATNRNHPSATTHTDGTNRNALYFTSMPPSDSNHITHYIITLLPPHFPTLQCSHFLINLHPVSSTHSNRLFATTQPIRLAPPLLRPPNHLYTQTGLPQPSEAHPAVKMIAPISTNLHYTRSVAHFTPQFKSSLHLNRPPTVLSGTSRCKDDRHLLRSDRPVAAE